MPDNVDKLALPFLTRDQLSFQHGQAFALRIQSQSAAATTLLIKGLTREGTFTFSHTTLGTGAVADVSYRIPDIPILVSVVNENAGYPQGATYVILSLTSNGDKLYELCAGQVSSTKGISYPQNNTENQRPTGGRIFTVYGSNPAAGVECSTTVPTLRIWRLLSYRVRFITAAAAANRSVHLVIDDGADDYMNMFGDTLQIISQDKVYTFAPFGYLPLRTEGNDILVPIPADIFLIAGENIKTETSSINAGDDFGAPTLRVEEFFSAA